MKTLVIGGTGFIGYHVVKRLVASGHSAAVMALPPVSADLSLPDAVDIILADLGSLSDRELVELLQSFDSFVFAVGADDRTVPVRPAWPFFEKANVLPLVRLVRLAGEAGLKAGVVMGSYFTHFNRVKPDWKLAKNNPYIRSRVEQQARGVEAASPGFRLMFLELPFIFGSVPGRMPLWTPLVKYLNSAMPVVCPKGGTAVVPVAGVAAATVEALERGEAGGCYPVAAQNLTWEELFRKLLRPGMRNRHFYRLPGTLLRAAVASAHFMNRLKGRESGLDMRKLGRILLSELFISSDGFIRDAAGSDADMDEAFLETIAAVYETNVNSI